jgi:hypothetical protein
MSLRPRRLGAACLSLLMGALLALAACEEV